MRLVSIALLALLSLSLCSSCIVAIGSGASDHLHSNWSWNGKRGSGVSSTQVRPVGEFRSVHFACSGELDVTVGQPQSVSISADDNLIDDLVSEVRDGVLVLSVRSGANLSFRVGPRVQISVPALTGLEVSGSGDAHVKGVAGDEFAARVQGSGSLAAAGSVTRLSVAVSGSGDADLGALECQDANVAVQGSGSARVHAAASLTAAVSGSGDVEYYGTPRTSVSVSGSGDVRQIR